MGSLGELVKAFGRFAGNRRESRDLVTILNRDLKAEEELRLRYLRQAQTLQSSQVTAKLRELAEGEAEHATLLRKWIRELGGEPIEPPSPSFPLIWTLSEALVQDYEAERRLYEAYLEQAELVGVEAIKGFLRRLSEEEERHLRELTALYSKYAF